LTNQHRIGTPSPEGRTAAAATWSPRNRLLFLIGATTAAWGVVALLIANWA